jgi:transcriptional regulator with XRE-family HTH domain
MTADGIECIEEGGTEPTIALLRRLATALDLSWATI